MHTILYIPAQARAASGAITEYYQSFEIIGEHILRLTPSAIVIKPSYPATGLTAMEISPSGVWMSIQEGMVVEISTFSISKSGDHHQQSEQQVATVWLETTGSPLYC